MSSTTGAQLWHTGGMASRARSIALTVTLIGFACHGADTSAPERAVALEDPGPANAASATATDDAAKVSPSTPERPPYTPASSLPAPTEIRLAKRTRYAYADTNTDAPVRGRIHSRETFYIYERREGPGCKRDWAKVAEAAWVCLEHSEASEQAPSVLPLLPDDSVLPFIYARHRAHDKASTPPLPVYANTEAYRSGADPIDSLPAYGSYAFTKVRKRGDEILMRTLNRRTVEGSQLTEFEASEFAGVELTTLQLAGEHHQLAWAVRWNPTIYAAPDPSSKPVGRVKYHSTFEVLEEAVEIPASEKKDRLWFEVPAHAQVPTGWIRADDIRRFIPLAPPEPVLGAQITIDVDLDQQVLSVWFEDAPVFATLISSGKKTDRTPTGLYRIISKRAYGKMQSLASAKDPYFVEAVPWTLYFKGRYAFHTAYWHNMFGHRMSHGCVNLSPRDAKRVFELATPTLPPGWLLVHEHTRDPGTLVRIRRQGSETADMREPLAEPASAP